MQNGKKLRIEDLGEFGFIARFSRHFLKKLPPGVLGIGDDCAVIPWKGRKKLLVTTDLLIDGVHFLKDRISALDLGYKSLAVNLSDIAAMGGNPRWAFLSIAIPAETEIAWLDEFFRGWRQLARRTGVDLLGGDTTKSRGGLVLNVVILGEADGKHLRYRSSARPGDIVAVTGNLGDSEGGLRLILKGEEKGRIKPEEKYLIRRHYRPRPHLEEGRFLAGQPEVRAMMDVSDGIDSDLRRIMERSDCGVRVFLEQLPISPALKKCASRYHWNLDEVAVAGGEDYCLLLTVAPEKFTGLAEKFFRRFGRPLPAIGQIAGEKNRLRYFRDGHQVELKKSGYDHFRTE
ncbi:MAG: thiamine-phosphate kinase [Candidatus Saccharicenans sp.]|jgi:thiamine-monophosphate kinase|nr:thiamine-phosphate kinase [Candidatus Saccharicenans sp.]MDH7575711.1 thiamine-phosphate kinase [Candidatus Saccharicenans sp.]